MRINKPLLEWLNEIDEITDRREQREKERACMESIAWDVRHD